MMKHMRKLFLILVISGLFGAHSFAGIRLAVNIAPPPIAVFDQPACPADGYIWTPGYYQYGDYGYYWVPGQWVLPPSVGMLWTPGYWGFGGGKYAWHEGYWGTRVGFYGGINYGNGYFGSGFNGKGGIKVQPSRDEAEASRTPHQGPTPVQVSHAQDAHNSHLAAHGAARN